MSRDPTPNLFIWKDFRPFSVVIHNRKWFSGDRRNIRYMPYCYVSIYFVTTKKGIGLTFNKYSCPFNTSINISDGNWQDRGILLLELVSSLKAISSSLIPTFRVRFCDGFYTQSPWRPVALYKSCILCRCSKDKSSPERWLVATFSGRRWGRSHRKSLNGIPWRCTGGFFSLLFELSTSLATNKVDIKTSWFLPCFLSHKKYIVRLQYIFLTITLVCLQHTVACSYLVSCAY